MKGITVLLANCSLEKMLTNARRATTVPRDQKIKSHAQLEATSTSTIKHPVSSALPVTTAPQAQPPKPTQLSAQLGLSV
jgi:hypothetical protein